MKRLAMMLARTVMVVVVRRLWVPGRWMRLRSGGPSAWRLAKDEEQIGRLLSLVAAEYLPPDTDAVCLTCLGHRIHELPSKWQQGIHGRAAVHGPPRRDMRHWRP